MMASDQNLLYQDLTIWIICCKWLGLFPYKNATKWQPSQKTNLDIVRCFLCYIVNQILDIKYKGYNKHNLYGWFMGIFELTFLILWLIFWFTFNKRFLSVTHEIDNFDKQFHKYFGKMPCTRICWHNRWSTRIIFFVYLLDIFFMGAMIIAVGHSLRAALKMCGFRAFQRTLMVLFFTIYLYLLNIVKEKYKAINSIWTTNVETKIGQPSQADVLFKNINYIILLHSQLFGIIKLFNLCFGKLLCVAYCHIAFLMLLNFYFTCTEHWTVLLLALFYWTSFTITTLVTQNVTNKASSILQNLVLIPLNEVPERIVLQVRMFILQVHSNPVQISAVGYFTIDQALLSSLMMAFASYLVAIFQLAPIMRDIGNRTIVSIE